MPLFGQLFLSEVMKRPVFDARGDAIGRVRDLIVVKGEYLPKVSAIIVARGGALFRIPWQDIEIFSKRLLSTRVDRAAIESYQPSPEDLLTAREILDRQIVDANGAKVVRVNDIKLEAYNGDAVLVAVDVGVRGILRRLGIERRSGQLFELLRVQLPYTLVSWNYIQPLNPKLKTITLTVPRQMLSQLHPADIADIISTISRDEGRSLLTDLDVKTAAEALPELEARRQVDIINAMDTEKAADILEEMPPDEASDVLTDLPAEKAKEILEHIEDDEARDIQELLAYAEDTAGGLMTNQFVAYGPDTTVKAAIERFRTDAATLEAVYYIYVITDEEKLIGSVALRDLLLAPPTARLADIMERKPKTVRPDADEKAIAEIISKYNLIAVPVVDEQGRLLGVVTIDDIMDRIFPSSVKRRRKRA
jgi:CBS domain-containing protein